MAGHGYRFISWNGDAFGTNSVISMIMDSNKTIIANFESVPYLIAQFTAGIGKPYTIPVMLGIGDILEGSMSVTGGNNDIRFYIKDPSGSIVVDGNRVQQSYSFSLTSVSSGQYIMYFDNSFSFITSKKVHLNYRTY